MSKSEAYLDIVWKQFKRNRFALVALYVLAPWFLLAVFAPLIGSDQPFAFRDGDQLIYPWVRALFNPEEAVDFAFNMALVGFVPWAVLALGFNLWWKRRGVPGRRRLLWVSGLYAGIIALLIALFSFSAVRPDNRYRQRTFREEHFQWLQAAQQAADEGEPPPEVHKGLLYPPIPFGPREQDLGAIYQPPMFQKDRSHWQDVNDGYVHVFGTDDIGRDVLVRMIYGSRIALTVGFVAVGIYVTLGIIVGAMAGYFGGAVDVVLSRIIEIVLLFPSFFLILTVVALFGPSIFIIMVVIGLTRWPQVARLIRGEVLKQRAMDYVVAARALGSSPPRIIFRHILPNALSPALVAAPFGVASAIITEAGLSLLGFGVRPPAPSWGAFLQLGSGNYSYWWLIVVPSVAIFIVVTVFNLIGAGLRDAMDPRLRM